MSFRPSALNITQFYYPLGNTPAACLTQELPPEEPATLLLLGCGDARHVLFTTYADLNENRQLDFTCCDNQVAVLARNILLFTLLVDEDFESQRLCAFNLYYSLYISDHDVSHLHNKAKELCELAKDPIAWSRSKYGTFVQFCNDQTFYDVRRIWESYLWSEKSSSQRKKLAKTFEGQITRSKRFSAVKSGENFTSLTRLRSIAPLSTKAFQDIKNIDRKFGDKPNNPNIQKHINPTLMPPAASTALLHYGTDDVLGFHLGTAYAHLADGSPLHPNLSDCAKEEKLIRVAQSQFFAWASSFTLRVTQNKIIIRVFSGDAIHFAYSLQLASITPESTQSTLYQDSFTMKPIVLSEAYNGEKASAPTSFNVVDTSNLIDHLGSLNVLIAAIPLMQDTPHASLYTEKLLRDDHDSPKMSETLLLGDIASLSTLLKVFPVEFWTNSSSTAPEEEMLQSLFNTMGFKTKNSHCRLLWKTSPTNLEASSRISIHYSETSISQLLYKVYLEMFQNENHRRNFAQLELGQVSFAGSICLYHRGSFAALCAFLKRNISLDWNAAFDTLLRLVENDRQLLIGSSYVQELYVYFHLFGLHTTNWIKNPAEFLDHSEGSASLSKWDDKPGVLRVTLVVPRDRLSLFTDHIDNAWKIGTPNLHCALESVNLENIFAAVNCTFGNIETHGQRNTSSFLVNVEEDLLGWKGKSPLVVSFWAPTIALLWEPCVVRFGLQSTPMTVATYMAKLGMKLSIFSTRLNDTEHVYVTKDAPHLQGLPTVFDPPLQDPLRENAVHISVAGNLGELGQLISVDGRVSIRDDEVLTRLRAKASVSISRKDAFSVDVHVADHSVTNTFTIQYPVPVNHAKSKVHIVRSSGYIKVIAPVVRPPVSTLKDFIVVMSLRNGEPILWGMPRINLDCLPILDTTEKSEIEWLTTHTSLMWSWREREIRTTHLHRELCPDPNLNFKEALFSIFMSFTGLQGPKSRIFGLYQEAKRSIDTLIIPHLLRLDVANHTVVLDALIFPLSDEPARSVLKRILDTTKVLLLPVGDSELEIWKRMLTAYIERCRTWEHTSSCEYRSCGRIPLSTNHNETQQCSCGSGKIDQSAIRDLPEFAALCTRSSRAAISPYYGMPFVEKLYDPAQIDLQPNKKACANCGATKSDTGASLSTCARCSKTYYCSRTCQRKNWKEHKRSCGKA